MTYIFFVPFYLSLNSIQLYHQILSSILFIFYFYSYQLLNKYVLITSLVYPQKWIINSILFVSQFYSTVLLSTIQLKFFSPFNSIHQLRNQYVITTSLNFLHKSIINNLVQSSANVKFTFCLQRLYELSKTDSKIMFTYTYIMCFMILYEATPYLEFKKCKYVQWKGLLFLLELHYYYFYLNLLISVTIDSLTWL